MARASRTRSSWRTRRSCAPPVSAVSTPSAASPTTLSESVLAVLSSPDDKLESRLETLVSILEADGMPSPGLARSQHLRKGGVFMHRAPREVLRQRAAPSSSCSPPLDGVPRFNCTQPGELPAAAVALLARDTPCAMVLRGHGLWPAAEDRWGDRAFLETELASVSCAVLSAPASCKDFLYWMPPRRYAGLEDALRRGGDRVLAPYAFDEPSVAQLNLGIREFFALADGSDANGRGRCFYLQHRMIHGKKAEGGVATMQPTAGLGEAIVNDITNGLNRDLLEKLRVAADLGPWSVTVVFVGDAKQAGGARTRLHYDMVDSNPPPSISLCLVRCPAAHGSTFDLPRRQTSICKWPAPRRSVSFRRARAATSIRTRITTQWTAPHKST